MDISARFLALTLHGATWVLWLLIALSVISVAVMLERLWYFQTRRLHKRTLVRDMRALLADVEAPAADLEAARDGAKAREKLRLERNLAFLATLGSNAPFIGLFGTVLGIIKAFHDLAANQGAGGGPSVVMAGISEALVATAVGLMVAIPAVVAFNVFQGKVRRAMAEVDAMAHRVLSTIRPPGNG